MENENIFRKTLVMIGALVGANVVVVGSITLIALFAINKANGSDSTADTTVSPSASPRVMTGGASSKVKSPPKDPEQI